MTLTRRWLGNGCQSWLLADETCHLVTISLLHELLRSASAASAIEFSLFQSVSSCMHIKDWDRVSIKIWSNVRLLPSFVTILQLHQCCCQTYISASGIRQMSYLFSASDDGMSNHLGIATSLEGRPPTAYFTPAKEKTKNEFIFFLHHKILFSHFGKNTDGHNVRSGKWNCSFYKSRELLLLYICLEN